MYSFTHDVDEELYNAVKDLKIIKLTMSFYFQISSSNGLTSKFIRKFNKRLHIRVLRTFAISSYAEKMILQSGEDEDYIRKAILDTIYFTLAHYVDFRIIILFCDLFKIQLKTLYELKYWRICGVDIEWALKWFDLQKKDPNFVNKINQPHLLYECCKNSIDAHEFKLFAEKIEEDDEEMVENEELEEYEDNFHTKSEDEIEEENE